MGHPRTAARGLVMLGALALVAGCIPTLADDDPSGDPSTAKVGAGQLTEEQIASVLPGEDEIPEGFSPEPDDGAPSDPEATAYPATCLDVRLAGTAGKELGTHRTARRTADFVGSEGGYLSVTVSSHDQPVPAQLFDDAGAAESQCGTFQLIDKEGTTSWKLSRVAFPQLGDRTYTTRVEATTEGDIFRGGVIQIAGVSVGNNLVYVVYNAGPASRYEPTAVETFAKTTVDNLNAL